MNYSSIVQLEDTFDEINDDDPAARCERRIVAGKVGQAAYVNDPEEANPEEGKFVKIQREVS
eukprot:11494361-Karenia_brevis.AAC.1